LAAAFKHTGDIAHSVQRPDGMSSGFKRGSDPSHNKIFARTQYPVAANQIMAAPTKAVKSAHQGE
jgi:hypothetical protein